MDCPEYRLLLLHESVASVVFDSESSGGEYVFVRLDFLYDGRVVLKIINREGADSNC